MENPLRISEEAKFYNKLVKRKYFSLNLIGEDRSLSKIVFEFVKLIKSTKNGRELLNRKSEEFALEELKELIRVFKEKRRENLLWYIGKNSRYIKKKDIQKLVRINKKLNLFKLKWFCEGVGYFIGSKFFRNAAEREVVEVAVALRKIKPNKKRISIKKDEAGYFKKMAERKNHKHVSLFIEYLKECERLVEKFEELIKGFGEENENYLVMIIINSENKKEMLEVLKKLLEEMKGIEKHIDIKKGLRREEILKNSLMNVLGIIENTPKGEGEKIVKSLVRNNKGEYLRINLFKIYLFIDMGFSYKKLKKKVEELNNEKLLYYLREIYELVRDKYFNKVKEGFV